MSDAPPKRKAPVIAQIPKEPEIVLHGVGTDADLISGEDNIDVDLDFGGYEYPRD